MGAWTAKKTRGRRTSGRKSAEKWSKALNVAQHTCFSSAPGTLRHKGSNQTLRFLLNEGGVDCACLRATPCHHEAHGGLFFFHFWQRLDGEAIYILLLLYIEGAQVQAPAPEIVAQRFLQCLGPIFEGVPL